MLDKLTRFLSVHYQSTGEKMFILDPHEMMFLMLVKYPVKRRRIYTVIKNLLMIACYNA